MISEAFARTHTLCFTLSMQYVVYRGTFVFYYFLKDKMFLDIFLNLVIIYFLLITV